MPVDFNGKNLKVGDTVIYITGSYRDFSYAKIIKLGKAKATIKPGKGRQTFRYYSDLIKGEK